MLEGLVVVGACGNAAEVIEAANCLSGLERNLTPVGILDDRPELAGSHFHGLPVLGPLSFAASLPSCRFVFAVGSVRTHARRLALIDCLGLATERFATVVHPQAWVSPTATLGQGVFVAAGCVVGPNARLGDHALLLPGCVLGHDALIGAGSCLASSVALAGGVRVEEEVYIGMGSRVREGVSLGRRCLVGMGAVVLHDVAAGARVAGCPAKPLGPAKS